jgi:hypothetical protein
MRRLALGRRRVRLILSPCGGDAAAELRDESAPSDYGLNACVVFQDKLRANVLDGGVLAGLRELEGAFDYGGATIHGARHAPRQR